MWKDFIDSYVNKGNLNKICDFYACQFPGSDIVLQLCKYYQQGKVGDCIHSLSVPFSATFFESLIISKVKVFKNGCLDGPHQKITLRITVTFPPLATDLYRNGLGLLSLYDIHRLSTDTLSMLLNDSCPWPPLVPSFYWGVCLPCLYLQLPEIFITQSQRSSPSSRFFRFWQQQKASPNEFCTILHLPDESKFFEADSFSVMCTPVSPSPRTAPNT